MLKHLCVQLEKQVDYVETTEPDGKRRLVCQKNDCPRRKTCRDADFSYLTKADGTVVRWVPESAPIEPEELPPWWLDKDDKLFGGREDFSDGKEDY